jgi:hypothetical protein
MTVYKFPEGAGGNAPPFDQGGGGGDDRQVDRRLTILETRWDAVIPTLATKGDLSDMALKIIGSMIAAGALSLGILVFVINRAAPPPSAPAVQPIIIQIPVAPAPVQQVAPTAPIPAPAAPGRPVRK